MKFRRIATNNNRNTHHCAYYILARNSALKYTQSLQGETIDPFARNCSWGTITNDIDPSFDTHYNLDVIEFFDCLGSGIAKLILFDPPFSQRQCDEKYQHADVNLYTTNKVSKALAECYRVLKPGGILVKLGYNSNMPNSHNWELLEVILAHVGGNSNDIIVTIWRKGQYRLDEFA